MQYKRAAVLGCINQIRVDLGGLGGDAEFVPRRPAALRFEMRFPFGQNRRAGHSPAASSSITLLNGANRQPEMPQNAAAERGPSQDNGQDRNDPPRGTGPQTTRNPPAPRVNNQPPTAGLSSTQ